MGIRSDVALGMKVEFYLALSEESRKTINEWFGSPTQRSDRGILFYAESVKWYSHSFDDLIELYSEIHEVAAEQFNQDECVVLLVANPEYPASTDGDIELWYENPWELYKSVSVCVEFNTE